MFVPEQYVGSGTGCIWQSRALQKSIRMNEIDYLVPAPPHGYAEGSLQSLAFTVAVASDVQLPPIPSSACRSWPPRPAEIRRLVKASCAEQREGHAPRAAHPVCARARACARTTGIARTRTRSSTVVFVPVRSCSFRYGRVRSGTVQFVPVRL